ncbi:cryptochrome/photolyase family protein [Haloferax sp. DFSO52]|uniref:cryptochrome/photolyase family protein n=1 Tax=Haloferax sp. DFSO52 TaxID=3388505 RepID=UPI003A8AB500
MHLYWHRRDLRTADNRGLVTAAAEDDVVPCFVFDTEVLTHAGSPRVRYLLDALAELRASYRAAGSDLLVGRGDPRTLVPAIATTLDVDRVVWNEDYTGLARTRDAAVRLALDDAGVGRESVHDAIFHQPGSITTNAGEPYSVYTYFWKKWRDREKPDPFPTPDGDRFADVETLESVAQSVPNVAVGDLPTIEDLGFDEPAGDVISAGTDAARRRLTDFCEDAIYRYEADRDYPSRDGTSKLSTDLKFGTIGIREVYAATVAARETVGGKRDESVEEFQSQLAWREFYTHVVRFNPNVVSENYKEFAHEIEWRDDTDELAAWKSGSTGYPIVDAGMRQLKAEAYMHNRVRMIVASFLTKDLLCDWRHGYAHFREYLSDHDTANDTGGWQWAASTGTDAQPYFRIFNPMTQGERYDPDAVYIKQYVPELEGVSPDAIHDWHELSDAERTRVAPDYPAPLVDHSERREMALAMFEAARGDD